jgi:curved DNA-binding protein CbpA
MKALKVLGLDSLPSDPLDLKKAYRHAALQNHPDRGGDPEMFRKVQEAYELLSNLRA